MLMRKIIQNIFMKFISVMQTSLKVPLTVYPTQTYTLHVASSLLFDAQLHPQNTIQQFLLKF